MYVCCKACCIHVSLYLIKERNKTKYPKIQTDGHDEKSAPLILDKRMFWSSANNIGMYTRRLEVREHLIEAA